MRLKRNARKRAAKRANARRLDRQRLGQPACQCSSCVTVAATSAVIEGLGELATDLDLKEQVETPKARVGILDMLRVAMMLFPPGARMNGSGLVFMGSESAEGDAEGRAQILQDGEPIMLGEISISNGSPHEGPLMRYSKGYGMDGEFIKAQIKVSR